MTPQWIGCPGRNIQYKIYPSRLEQEGILGVFGITDSNYQEGVASPPYVKEKVTDLGSMVILQPHKGLIIYMAKMHCFRRLGHF